MHNKLNNFTVQIYVIKHIVGESNSKACQQGLESRP